MRLHRIRRGLVNLLWKNRVDRDLDEELNSYLDQLTDEKIATGLSQQEARRASRIELGGLEPVKEQVREVSAGAGIEQLWKDALFGLRILRKNPAFTTIAVATLALGIGANTAIFSLVNAALLRPLPYRDSGRLILLWERPRGAPPGATNVVSSGSYLDWRARNHSFAEMAAVSDRNVNLSGAAEPEQVHAAELSANFFDLLGVRPVLGRAFVAGDDEWGHDRVAILSYGLWRRRFGGAGDVLGRDVSVDGERYAIVGVAPSGFHFQWKDCDLYLPLALNPAEINHANHYLFGLARLKPGVTLQYSRVELNEIARLVGEAHPDTNRDWGVTIQPLREALVGGDTRRSLWLLLGAVSLVLLIACVNVANLLLSRANGRQREIALRAALGASRARIARQLLTEGMLLAVTGGVLGLLVARFGIDSFMALMPDVVPAGVEVDLDLRVLGFAFAAAALSGTLFSLAPLLYSRQVSLIQALTEGGRTTTVGRRTARTGALLAVGEVALTVPLLIACGLLIRSLTALYACDAGFGPDNVLTAEVALTSKKYTDATTLTRFLTETLERVRALPGIQSAGIVSVLPLEGYWGQGFQVEGRPESEHASGSTNFQVVSPDYFQTMGIRLVAGRDFGDHDNARSPPVIVISDSIARRFFGDRDPIGEQMRVSVPRIESHLPGSFAPRTIVGVVGDVHAGIDVTEWNPVVYAPYTQAPNADQFIAVRTSSDPNSISDAVRRAIVSTDPDQSVGSFRSMERVVSRAVGPWRSSAQLFGAFAALAVVLAVVGIYGVLSYAVSRRTHEISVRVALGARPADVLRLILGQGANFVLLGVGIGLLGALALTRFLQSQLFNVSSTDPLTFLVVAVSLCLVALAACYIPARRASKVDTIAALRCE
jgi:putative ABC transport system permease protein